MPVAMAQGVDTGLEVRVNPLAMRGGELLLYPDGRGYRYVTPLLYPGQPANQLGGPVQLHPARKRPTRAARPATPRVATAPKPAPAPAPLPAPDTRTFAGGMFNSPALTLTPQTPVAPPAQKPVVQATAPKPAPVPAPAKPAAPGSANLTKRSVILFAKDASEPAEGALGAIKFLAADLNAAMTRPASRIELQAFGGGKGDKGSDARRLSLRRALAIRQVLISDGVSADRIDVRAMGGAEDSGPADRVDVYVRA